MRAMRVILWNARHMCATRFFTVYVGKFPRTVRMLGTAASTPRVCAQSRPRDDPGVPRPRKMRAGGRQTALPRRVA
eukprot:5366360-Prymnesium_polylepis.1